MLLFNPFLITPGSIICYPEFRVKGKSRITLHEKSGKYTRSISSELFNSIRIGTSKREAKKINTLQHCLKN